MMYCRKSSDVSNEAPMQMRQTKENTTTFSINQNNMDPGLKDLESKIAARLGSLYNETVEKTMSSSENETEGLMFDVGQQDKRMASALKR